MLPNLLRFQALPAPIPAFPQRGKEKMPLTLTLSRKREREQSWDATPSPTCGRGLG